MNIFLSQVLGLNSAKSLADIYAIGLQENCWECNKSSFSKIGEKFLGRIKKKVSFYTAISRNLTDFFQKCRRCTKKSIQT